MSFEVQYMTILVFLDSFNPENIIQFGGLTLLLLIIFAETGVYDVRQHGGIDAQNF